MNINLPVRTKEISFNSCMVQLKSPSSAAAFSPFQCFNSCMVQLKYNRANIEEAAYLVLIPVWCN